MTDNTPAPPKKKRGHNLKGRPPGTKNKTTIFKEAMRQGFEDKLMREGEKVFDAVISKAKDGDMTAAKLILDRILPTSKAIDLDQLEKSKGLQISINLGSLEKLVEEKDAVIIEDGEIISES